MHQKISDVTVLTIIISTILLIFLAAIIIYFLFAYQKKSHKHQKELLLLNESFNQTLLTSKLEIKEQTLDHIAKELHANISQLVSVININLSACLQRPAEAEDNIQETKALVKQLMSEVKRLSVTLNTEHIGRSGFETMLKKELEWLNKTGIYQINFQKEGDGFRFAPEKEIILFRLCQEILNNVIKHAEATQIDVHLSYSDNGLIIEIHDNGIGFNLNEIVRRAESSDSTGIHNIYHRSKQIDGTVEINSTPNEGTSIIVNLTI